MIHKKNEIKHKGKIALLRIQKSNYIEIFSISKSHSMEERQNYIERGVMHLRSQLKQLYRLSFKIMLRLRVPNLEKTTCTLNGTTIQF